VYEPPIRARARILRVVRHNLAEIELPNGKQTLGHLSPKLNAEAPELRTGMIAEVEMTPFDFDKARIVALGEAAAD